MFTFPEVLSARLFRLLQRDDTATQRAVTFSRVLLPSLPPTEHRYHEPFSGGGPKTKPGTISLRYVGYRIPFINCEKITHAAA